MKIFKIILLLLMILSAAALAQENDELTFAKIIRLNSKILGEERVIYVSTPASYSGSAKSYPVLYILDGSPSNIHYASGLISDLSDRALCPEMIVVAVANTNRMRDMTPTKATKNRNGDEVNFQGEYGEADNFLKFFEEELIPYVKSNYRTLPFRILSGHSGSAIAVVYSFISHNEMFNGYIAMSPTFWWDEHYLNKSISEKMAGLNLKQKFFYFSIGGKESTLNISDADQFNGTMQRLAPAELSWKYDFHRNETHGSQGTIGLLNGLRFIFDGWNFDYYRVQSEGLGYINNFYKNQSEKYGYSIEPSEAEMTSFGYALIRVRKFDEAIEILKRSTEKSPRAANAFDSLGDAYMAAGKIDEAIEVYQKAVTLGKENNDDRLSMFLENLEKARAAKK